MAFLFPFTQGGSDANMSIATQVIIFAVTAMGLNIVVGLAGLLDLGYIAFLGAGAYTAAVLSDSAFATVGWKPPFLLVVLIGACVSASLGLIIGTPTLRVSGDYLAIVTLAFGEIFRLAMGNLDGNNGPNLTNGPNGIPAIPDLVVFGWDFGQSHTVAGISLGRFANYYFLLLLLAAFVITVFARLNNSRIGRGWVAIREDEKAAEAMGVNVFGLKLFAFSSGAFLAGMAGTVKAHQDVSVTPDQYVFLEQRVPARRDRPRRYGDRGRRAHRVGHPPGAAREAAVHLRLPAAHLRPAARHHDAVPAGGHRRQPAPQAGVPRGRPGAGRTHRGDPPRGRGGDGMTATATDPTPRPRPRASSARPSWRPRGSSCGSAASRRSTTSTSLVREGEIVGLIGPNGAGKTTFFNCLTGLYKPTEGEVTFKGAILPPKPRKVVLAGMARTFQNIRLFGNMTALENVMVGRYCRTSAAGFTSIIRGPKFRREEAETRARSQELLDYVGLGKSGEYLARNMPYGDQRRLEIARALATDPQLLLLDEPTAGMNPQETRQAMDLIFKIRDSGIAVVVIEHDMRFIFTLCDRVLCLVRGETLVQGTPGEVQSDPRVIEAYIGTGDEDDEEAAEVERELDELDKRFPAEHPDDAKRTTDYPHDARGATEGEGGRQ